MCSLDDLGLGQQPFPPAAGRRSGADDPPGLQDGLPVRPRSRAEAVAMCDCVIDLMSALFGTSGRELREPGRGERSVSRVRQIGMYVARVTLGLRVVEIAAGFGRDKSTVVHACHIIEDLRDDVDFDRLVARAEHITRVAFSVPATCGGRHVR